jgi:hypothetical protein
MALWDFSTVHLTKDGTPGSADAVQSARVTSLLRQAGSQTVGERRITLVRREAITKVCTFFGHYSNNETSELVDLETLIPLIPEIFHGVNWFFR